MAKLSWAAEVFYRRLHSVVDDFGRYHAHPMLLRAACYPLQLDKVSDSDIGKWTRETEEAALVRVYPASDGNRYLEILDFRQQKRANKSKFPEPLTDAQQMLRTCTADATQPPANAHLGVVVFEGEGGKRAKRGPPKTPLPECFTFSARVLKWAEEREVHNLEQHLEYFIGKCKAKGYAYVDWDEAFMAAVRDDWAKIGKGMPAGQKKAVV